MNEVFVVRNQHGLFASKHKEWLDGRDPRLLFRTPYHDEAINLVFELSSKDIYLRAAAVTVPLGENKQPIVEVTAPCPEQGEASPLDDDTTQAQSDVAPTQAVEGEDAPNNTVDAQHSLPISNNVATEPCDDTQSASEPSQVISELDDKHTPADKEQLIPNSIEVDNDNLQSAEVIGELNH